MSGDRRDPAHGELGQAFASLYEQLRRIAQSRLAGCDAGTLQATALVHEALLKLAGVPADRFADEQHLLATAAQAIRQVIVDHVRAKATAKRGGGRLRPLSSPDLGVAVEDCSSERLALTLDIDQALSHLAGVDRQLRTIVELHVFGGIPLSEVGALVGCSQRTVHRRWAFASALLRERLDEWSTRGGAEADAGAAGNSLGLPGTG